MDYLIVGLGNIGSEYSLTRHNMGFMVLDAFAQASNAVFRKRRYGAVAKVTIGADDVYLLKPDTYMNLSGHAVAHWLKKLRVPVERLLVVCDDLNIPFGTLRMRAKGSAGGHNGLKDIEFLIDTQDYARIRIGIGNNFRGSTQVDFVLGKLLPEEKEQVAGIAKRAGEGIQTFVTQGADRAMNLVNTPPCKEQRPET